MLISIETYITYNFPEGPDPYHPPPPLDPHMTVVINFAVQEKKDTY